MAKPSMYLFLCALHADGVSTLLLTPEDELTFEGVAVQRSHLGDLTIDGEYRILAVDPFLGLVGLLNGEIGDGSVV